MNRRKFLQLLAYVPAVLIVPNVIAATTKVRQDNSVVNPYLGEKHDLYFIKGDKGYTLKVTTLKGETGLSKYGPMAPMLYADYVRDLTTGEVVKSRYYHDIPKVDIMDITVCYSLVELEGHICPFPRYLTNL